MGAAVHTLRRPLVELAGLSRRDWRELRAALVPAGGHTLRQDGDSGLKTPCHAIAPDPYPGMEPIRCPRGCDGTGERIGETLWTCTACHRTWRLAGTIPEVLTECIGKDSNEHHTTSDSHGNQVGHGDTPPAGA